MRLNEIASMGATASGGIATSITPPYSDPVKRYSLDELEEDLNTDTLESLEEDLEDFAPDNYEFTGGQKMDDLDEMGWHDEVHLMMKSDDEHIKYWATKLNKIFKTGDRHPRFLQKAMELIKRWDREFD